MKTKTLSIFALLIALLAADCLAGIKEKLITEGGEYAIKKLGVKPIFFKRD